MARSSTEADGAVGQATLAGQRLTDDQRNSIALAMDELERHADDPRMAALHRVLNAARNPTDFSEEEGGDLMDRADGDETLAPLRKAELAARREHVRRADERAHVQREHVRKSDEIARALETTRARLAKVDAFDFAERDRLRDLERDLGATMLRHESPGGAAARDQGLRDEVLRRAMGTGRV